MAEINQNEVYTTKEAQALLKISKSTIIKNRKLKLLSVPVSSAGIICGV